MPSILDRRPIHNPLHVHSVAVVSCTIYLTRSPCPLLAPLTEENQHSGLAPEHNSAEGGGAKISYTVVLASNLYKTTFKQITVIIIAAESP